MLCAALFAACSLNGGADTADVSIAVSLPSRAGREKSLIYYISVSHAMREEDRAAMEESLYSATFWGYVSGGEGQTGTITLTGIPAGEYVTFIIYFYDADDWSMAEVQADPDTATWAYFATTPAPVTIGHGTTVVRLLANRSA